MKYLLVLVGTLRDDVDMSNISRVAMDNGATHIYRVGREIAIEVFEKDAEKLKKALKNKVEKLSEVEFLKVESTVAESGKGKDSKGIIEVQVAPAAKNTGIKKLNINVVGNVPRKIVEIIEKEVQGVFKKALLTNILYSIKIRGERIKNKNIKEIKEAAKAAATAAIVDAQGTVLLY